MIGLTVKNENVLKIISMLQKIVFENEIVLYWDKQWHLPSGVEYRISCNGKGYARTKKTHCEIVGLQAETPYAVTVERLDENGAGVETLFSETIITSKKRKRIDVTTPPYNAVGDGKTLNTVALQRALDDCAAGETVYIPQGTYLTGALKMHGDTELYLEKAAILQGTANVEDYLPKRWSRFEGIERECYASLINIGNLDNKAGYTTKNVVIRGGGSIFGGGKALCDATIATEQERLKGWYLENAEYIKTCENEKTVAGRARGRLVAVYNAENVVFANVTFGFGAAWNLQFVYSKNIITYGCKIQSYGVWNGDGWDPDSSENCVIFGTEFATHDDAIAIKSGKNPEGNSIDRPTKCVRIFDCHGMRGIAIGSELSGGVEDVAVWDCQMNAFRVKTTKKRGGYVKNVRVYDSTFNADMRVTTRYAWNDDNLSAGTLTKLHNFHFENVKIIGYDNERQGDFPVAPIMLLGFEKQTPIENVTVKNVVIGKRIDGALPDFEIENVLGLKTENIQYE